MSTISAARPADGADDLREPNSLLESIRVLRSQNPHYMAILSPSAEQIEDIDAIIKGLRLEIDDGVDKTTGDETAYELAVALLWHTTPDLVKEGIDLMEYLLKERWNQRWSTVTHGWEAAAGALVESIADEPNESDLDGAGEGEEEEWVDLDVSHQTSQAPAPTRSSAGTTAKVSTDSRGGAVCVGTAVNYATAPPPPEDEGGSVPPSLVRGRESGSASPVLTQRTSSATASGDATASTHVQDSARVGAMSTPSTTSATCTSTSSYMTPCTDSSACTAAACASAAASSSPAREALTHDERLAKCYYHLAVGCTKLRRNDQGLFYVNNVLQLCPHDCDALRLKRLLCARVYVRGMVARSVPFLAIGLLFL